MELSAINSGTRNDNQLFLSYIDKQIGIGTNAPDANSFGAGHGILAVASATGSAKTAMLNLMGDGNDTDASRVASVFFNDQSATGAGKSLAGIEAYRASNHATDPGGDLVFSTNLSGGSYVEKMRIHSEGFVTKPLQPAFLVKLDGDQNNITAGGASNTLVQFDDEVFDANSDFDTSNSRFTAPVTGKYLLTYMLRVHNLDEASTSWSVIMATSNRNISAYYGPSAFDSDANYWTFTYTMVHDMDANDLATVTVYQDGGTAQADISQYSYFSGQLIS